MSKRFNGRATRPVTARTFCRLSTRIPREWRVEPRICSQPGTPMLTSSRCRSSAATFVNVTGNMRVGATPPSSSRATLRLSAKDFPVPGPARTRM